VLFLDCKIENPIPFSAIQLVNLVLVSLEKHLNALNVVMSSFHMQCITIVKVFNLMLHIVSGIVIRVALGAMGAQVFANRSVFFFTLALALFGTVVQSSLPTVNKVDIVCTSFDKRLNAL